MTPKFLRLALILGLLSAIGPFAIDMYLPALPAIGQGLSADMRSVQLSLMSFFLALAVSQIAYGPAADMLGRKPPLYFGMVLFTLGSVGCALAPSIDSLLAFRFVQGLGGGAAMVIPRAIVRDLYSGNDAARLMSLLMLVFSVCPILAPLAGSLVIDSWGWRAIFWAIAAVGVAGLVLMATALRETRSREDRAQSSWRTTAAGFSTLLRDRRFLGLTFIGAFGLASFFIFLANSSFVMIEHYGLTAQQYSVAFSINAVSFIGVAQFTGWLTRRFGLPNVVRTAVIGYALMMLLLLGLFVVGIDPLAVLIALLFIGFGFLGLVVPTTSVLALDDHGDIAGTASALMGTLQLVTGAVLIAVSSLVMDGTGLPMVAGIALCATVAWALTHVTLSSSRAPAPSPTPTGQVGEFTPTQSTAKSRR